MPEAAQCGRFRVEAYHPSSSFEPTFDGNWHFRDRDWRITNRFGEGGVWIRKFFRGFLDDKVWKIYGIYFQITGELMFLGLRLSNIEGFGLGNLRDFQWKFHFWIKYIENIYICNIIAACLFDFRKNFWSQDWIIKLLNILKKFGRFLEITFLKI